jgi:hypothetical protein
LSCGSARCLQEAPSAPEPRIPGDEYYHAFPWLNGLRHGVRAEVGVAEAIEFLLKLPRRDVAWREYASASKPIESTFPSTNRAR